MVSPPDQQNTHNLTQSTDRNGGPATAFVPGALGAGDRHRVRERSAGNLPRRAASSAGGGEEEVTNSVALV
jgi:hypothetical protein